MDPWASYAMPPGKPPLPVGIPEEWQKANEALQAVQQPKTSAAETPTTNQNHAGNVNEFQFGWRQQQQQQQQQMFRFPAPGVLFDWFTSYPQIYPYNYNYNYPMNSNPYMFNHMASPAQVSPAVPSPSPTQAKTPKAGKSESNSENVPVPQPPPPPASSPAVEATYFTNIDSQAPNSGGIRFNLPKKNKNSKNAFQATRDALQQRMNNFAIGNSFPKVSPQNIAQAHQDMIAQKSVSSMAADSWPQSLKDYVTRCFDKCKTDIDKDQVELILKGKLLKANTDGTLRTKDWESEPLPSTHSDRMEQEEKQQAVIQKMPSILKSQEKKFPSPNSRNNFQNRPRPNFYHPRSRSHSRSHSRSRSRSPQRKVFRRRKYSSSSDSSGGSRSSKKTLSSSVIGPSELRTPRNTPNNISKNKKKKKRAMKQAFTVEPEFCTDERLIKRAARFEVKGASRSPKPNSLVLSISNPFIIDETGDQMEWESDAIIGTCQELEKPFLRLTGAVDPSGVRPEEVLKKSLFMVKNRWTANQDYHFACEQLKSIRQDLVVQCIRNKFTVEVYETHARIALEKGDHTEFNQCQSQLKVLYQEIKEGSKLEFTGYHVLYTMYTENTIELKNILTDLTSEEKSDKVVSHAIKIAKACSSNNYSRFFKLYLTTPMMSAYIIDWFIERIRKAALKAIIKSFRPNIPVSYIQTALAFPSSEECMAFLTKANPVFVDPGTINCKESVGPLANF